MSQPPFLLRIAGLPASAIEHFSSPELLGRASRRRTVEERLERLREELVNALHREIGDQDPGIRTFLLTLKRDSFNQRPLARHCDDPRWTSLAKPLRDLMEEALRLEYELARDMDGLREAWECQLQRERRDLRRHLDDTTLLRGLSLASRPLVERLSALGTEPPTRRDRKQRKLEQSLLRYVSRAAVKLSPYSTLTRVGVGVVTTLEGEERVDLSGSGWHETSLVRMRRYIVDQIAMVLAYSQALRGELRFRLNDTLEKLPAGNYQLLRPELLRRDETVGQLRYVRMSLARLALDGPIVESVLSALEGLVDGLSVAEICRRCLELDPPRDENEGRHRQDIEGWIDALLGAGVLLPNPPWTTDEVHLERAVAETLNGLEGTPDVVSLRNNLATLVGRQSQFATGDRQPALALQEMGSLIQTIWDESCELADTELRLLFPAGEKYNFYEDVFLNSAGDGGEIARLDVERAEELLSVGDALWRLSDFYHPRREFLLAVDRLIEKRWGEQAVPFLRVFQEAQGLWKDFVAFKYDQRDSFDPFDSEAVQTLRESRQLLRQDLLALGESEILDIDRLFAIQDRIPQEHASDVGSCLFIQPLDPSGEKWVLNRLFEGSGRYTSRFTSAMPEPLRRSYLSHYVRCCRTASANGSGEIVDLLYGQENTVNLHYPQTPRVLVIPGQSSRVPRHRRLYLEDVSIQRDARQGTPYLVDCRGRRLLPCHFSAVNGMYLPVLVKFLSAFGPSSGAGKAIFPWRTEECDGVTVSAPIEAGRLLVRRRRWIFPASALPQDHQDVTSRFVALDRWRARHGIPLRVFSIEKIDENETGQPVFKPQYVDFSSPLLTEIFYGQLGEGEEKVTLEEALPTPDAYLADGEGKRWATEVVLESLALSRLPARRAAPHQRRPTGRSVAIRKPNRYPPSIQEGGLSEGESLRKARP